MPELPGAAFRNDTVRAGEFTLDYAEAGPPDAQLTIVSLPGSAGLEMSVAKDRLAAEYRVIEINPPGWGGKTDLDRPMSQAELGELLAEAATSLVDGPFVVIGTSMGGTNALYLAAAVPDRVLGIVLEGSMAPAAIDDVLVQAPTGQSGPPQDYPLPPVHPRKPWATHEFMKEQMGHRMAMMRWVAPDFEAASAVAAVRERGIPVLALVGDQDAILAPSVGKTVKQALPHADFRLVKDGEHDLQGTVPDTFVQLVSDFVVGLDTARKTGSA
jgi:pimeloyl-ACP methyl ester carboxylesterase